MTIIEKLAEIKKIVFNQEAPAPLTEPIVPVEAAKDYPLADGTILTIDKLEVGGSVLVGAEPAADGSYQLEDGTSLSVLSGVIAEVKTKEAEEATEMKEVVSGLNQAFTSHKSESEKEIGQLKETVKKQQEKIEAMFSFIEEIAEKGIEKPLEQEVDFDSLTPLQKFRALKN